VFALIALAAAVVGFALGYYVARARGVRQSEAPASAPAPVSVPLPAPPTEHSVATIIAPPVSVVPDHARIETAASVTEERARIIRSYEAEAATLRAELIARDAAIAQLRAYADERSRQFAELAQARAETARYRQLVVDLENNAPPVLFGPGTPDDLKLIVGIGPVLERMLHQLGVTTYRQIARWTERDIDEFDARLPEFPGRIRRDAWVTQARAIHQSKYGERL